MPYVRCPECATKLLPIASTCTRCRHLLVLPAAFRLASTCARCDSLVPWQAARCAWCLAPRSILERALALARTLVARAMHRA